MTLIRILTLFVNTVSTWKLLVVDTVSILEQRINKGKVAVTRRPGVGVTT